MFGHQDGSTNRLESPLYMHAHILYIGFNFIFKSRCVYATIFCLMFNTLYRFERNMCVWRGANTISYCMWLYFSRQCQSLRWWFISWFLCSFDAIAIVFYPNRNATHSAADTVVLLLCGLGCGRSRMIYIYSTTKSSHNVQRFKNKKQQKRAHSTWFTTPIANEAMVTQLLCALRHRRCRGSIVCSIEIVKFKLVQCIHTHRLQKFTGTVITIP